MNMKKIVFLTSFLVSLTLFVTIGYWKPALTNRSIQPKFISGGQQSLSPQVINGVKKFLFFAGYSRSGHSIIGSLMDAHPHVVIAHEFYVFEKIQLLDKARSGSWKVDFFNKLYQKSVRDVSKLHANAVKGYTLGVEGLWQGKFDKYIEVLGDKGGAHVTLEYLENKERFISNYHKLQKELSIPIRIIHAIRNPFDMVATNTAWESNKSRFLKMKGALYSNESKREELSDQEKISAFYNTDREIFVKFKMFKAVVELIDIFGKENVLEVHNCDLVNDPRGTISRIFDFLEVEASPRYLDVCAEKVFKSVSRSRNLIKWTQEQRERVERKMKKYPMFDRYSFTSD